MCDLCMPVAALFAFVWACAVVVRRRHRGRVWWFLNRVRAAIAFEPDPGPWADRPGRPDEETP